MAKKPKAKHRSVAVSPPGVGGRPPVYSPADADTARRSREVARQRSLLAQASDVGDIPRPAKPERRASCERDLNLFLRTYFPLSTGLTPFSPDHDEVIAIIQGCILTSGAYANAVYRGFAKSTIGEHAILWGALYGHVRFGAIFAAESSLAKDSLGSVKMELAENDLLLEDFPEVCVPFRALEGKSQRCGSQTHQGVRTHIKWTVDKVVFPAVQGSVSSGSVIAARGMTASILGLRHKTPDGRQLRPDFVLVDDPQTRDSAKHPQQVKKRLDILSKSILMLAGHRSRMACVVNGTVIAEDDMMHQLLDARKYPAFQGKRIAMVKAFADRHEDLWMGKYRDLRHGFRKDDPADKERAHAEANAFYTTNRKAMDAGCVVSWESCFSEQRGEISAIQHAYNILLDEGPEVFASECQNEPMVDASVVASIKQEDVISSVINVGRWIVPAGCEQVVAFIDVQEKLLYWLVSAWGEGLRGHVVAYGTYPEQSRSYFTLRDARKTLAKVAGAATKEAAIAAGLPLLEQELLGREYVREDDELRIRCSALFVDANWAQTRNVVRDFARRARFAGRVYPTHGRYVGVTGGSDFDKKADRGERSGPNWRTETKERVRHVTYDTNAWKSLVAEKLRLPSGDTSAITIHAGRHDLLADHLTAEYPIRAESKLRVCDEWKLTPGRDNHWLDCLVGCAVAASFAGISGVGATAASPSRQRRRYSPEEVAARKAAVLAMAGG